MSWLSKLLGFEDTVVSDVGKLIENSRKESVELFSVTKRTKGKDISEPVFVMLNAWKQNPKRFVLKLDKDISNLWTDTIHSYENLSSGLKVIDSESQEAFYFELSLNTDSYSDGYTTTYHMFAKFAKHKIYPVLGSEAISRPSWMTQDELDFIVDTVKPYYLKRVNRYRDIVESRIDRTRRASEMKSEIAKQKERDRLMGVYK